MAGVNSKRKIVAIIPSAFCFGLQHVTIDLLAALKDRVVVHFFVTKWNNGEFIKLLGRNQFGYSLSWLGMFSRKLDLYNIKMSLHALSKVPKLYWDTVRIIQNQKPDALLFANHHELILLLPVLWFIRTPVVCHMHDPAPNIPFQRSTFAWYGRRVNHFVAISGNVKKRLIDLGCPETKITVVHNGINVPKKTLKRSGERWPLDNFVIGITGQMTETKGHEDLLKAFQLALTKNNKLRLLIGGKKLEPLYSRLNDQIREMGLSNFVAFTGWLEDVSEFYSCIDLYVLASRHDEGYGLVVAEAMVNGKPVVITDSGGASEIVEDKKNGFVVPKKAIGEMADKIVILANDKDLYQEFSKSAVLRIENHFTMITSSESFFNVLMKCMES